ncbi:MAG TPA: PIN domain-containing protein [Pyrinomonadaceae bacterium]|jgi:predicted nucleic acid-binding protein
MSIRIPSDDLLRLRELSLNWAPLFRMLEIGPQLRLVIDTNVIIEELLFVATKLRNPANRTALQEAIDSGAVVALAPYELLEEVEEKITLFAEERGIPEESLRRAWSEYLPRISFVAAGQASAEEEAAAVDPDDLPFVRLCRRLGADAVVSRDRHIRAMGARSVNKEVMIHVRDYARAKAPEVTLRFGALVVTVPVAAGAHALIKVLGKLARGFAGLPPVVQLALVAGAVAAGAHPRSRRALSSFAAEHASKMKEPALLLLQGLQALMERLSEAEERVWSSQEVLERSIPRAAKRPLRLVARSVCLEAGRALTPEELTRGVLRAGYESSSSRLKYYLLRVLRQSEQFVCTSDGCWTVKPGEEPPRPGNLRMV